MEIPLFDNSGQVPQPKDNIRIEDLNVIPYPDRFRVFISIKVTPFQVRPNLLLVMRSLNETIIGELNVIETMHADMEFTMHVRGVDDPAGDYTFTADLFYESRNPPQDRKTISFTIPSADPQES